MHTTSKEAECWRIAQSAEEILETDLGFEVMDTSGPPQRNAQARWRCQVDASWINERDITGIGFVLMDVDFPMLYGARTNICTKSPLQAEAEGLLWAMPIYAPNHHCRRKLKKEDWPALALELDEIQALSKEFSEIYVAYIPRSLNFRADSFAKGARSCASDTAFVNPFAPSWLAPQAKLRVTN
ncbi:uncharacterized protein LOC103829594 [Brassica rapa]|uniref:uncharacterized protein LOC103829594 n=1 Tax=Brassica campestris TaxID=3711 RepID=UPI00142DEF2D|nr:uncharacterized protein LOC103829594 [Brassica rapa]